MSDNAMYLRKMNEKVHKKIDKIVEETKVPKWMIVENLLSNSLGIKTKKNGLDLKKWLRN